MNLLGFWIPFGVGFGCALAVLILLFCVALGYEWIWLGQSPEGLVLGLSRHNARRLRKGEPHDA